MGENRSQLGSRFSILEMNEDEEHTLSEAIVIENNTIKGESTHTKQTMKGMEKKVMSIEGKTMTREPPRNPFDKTHTDGNVISLQEDVISRRNVADGETGNNGITKIH